MLDKLFNFLGVEKQEAPSSLVDFSLMGVDLHSHLIPGIDDGVKTLEESVTILKQMKGLGFSKVVTTPHVMTDGFNNSSDIILKGRDDVREALHNSGVEIDFDAAAEYYLDDTLNEKIEKKDLLKIAKDYVLVELSFYALTFNVADLVYKMQVAGYDVILAHPERYAYYYEDNFESYRALKDHGIFFQTNLMSLTGRYGTRAKAMAERMIDENMVDFVGTDLHGARHIPAIKDTLMEKYLEKILNSDKLLNKTLL